MGQVLFNISSSWKKRGQTQQETGLASHDNYVMSTAGTDLGAKNTITASGSLRQT